MPHPEGPRTADAPAVAPWWRDAVVYQIYPRSFADGDGDGVGDLAGIRAHLEELAWLGVDAVWLSPFYRSPMVDFGYDVADHCDVDPIFGTLASFDALVAEAHALGLRVLVDWVPNHTSDRHPWFEASRSGRDDPKRSWYVWRDPGPDGGPPNNWTSAFDPSAPAWTFDATTGQWYLHLFDPSQPDLDWDEPAVEAAMHDVLRFWLDRGVDGFRADVVHCIGKDPALPDDPPGLAGLPHCVLNDVPATHERLRAVRRLLDGYPGDRVIVGEVYLLDTATVATYHGDGDELHLAFNFPPLLAPWRSDRWRACVADTESAYGARRAWPTWVLSNHDNPRHRTRYDLGAALAGDGPDEVARRSEPRARAAAVLLCTLRGTPFLYQGEELGLTDAELGDADRVDPGGRDGCRAPLPWDGSPGHGWPVGGGDGPRPWLPLPPGSDRVHRDAQRRDPGSVLHLYRRLLAERRASPALRSGRLELLDAPDGVLAYRRSADGDERVVLVNQTGAPRPVGGIVPDGWRVVVDDLDAGAAGPFSGRLGPDQAVVLAP